MVALLWVLGGLLFYEKCLLVIGALRHRRPGLLHDRRPARAGSTTPGERYRGATVLYVVTGVAYLAFYSQWALNFSPKQAGNDALGEVITNMVFYGLPAGGARRAAPVGRDRPVLARLAQRRDRAGAASSSGGWCSARSIASPVARPCGAWFLPAFFLGCDIVLVLAGRASFVGALISLDFRYQGELPAATAMALACATMPILGAREPVEVRGTSELLDHRAGSPPPSP